MTQPKINFRAISDPALIRILASPLRQELVDTLTALGGEASVAAIATQLGRHADGLYYHLRILCKAGLLMEVMDEHKQERRYRLAGAAQMPMRLAYHIASSEEASALREFANGMLQVASQDFEQALDIPDVVTEGSQRQLWAARNKAWLSAQELEEVNALLERICELMSRPRSQGCDQLMSCSFLLAPIAPRPKRRKKTE